MRVVGVVGLVAGMALAGALGAWPLVQADDDDDDDDDARMQASLRGFEEPPAVSSTGRGEFRARISPGGDSFNYTLSYTALEGNVAQAHIHLGQKGVNGGISVFLCTNLGNGPAGTPLCPGTTEGTVSGTITAASVVGPAPQGIAVGELAELLRAIDKNATYVNVHSSKFPGGEIRGQIDSDD